MSSVRIVAVPGLGLSAAVPRHTFDALGPTVAPTAVELPAFGLPAPRGEALDPGHLADLLLVHLDALEQAPVVLLGHSASCQIVVEAAARAPGRVAALVLVGPTTDPRAPGWPGLVRRWLRTAAHERPGQVPRLVHDYVRTGGRAMLAGMDAARRHRIERPLAGVGCPVLVVRGRRDRIAPQDWIERLAALAPRGVTATLPAGAHMVPITHPGLLADAVHAFVRSAGVRT